MSWPVVALADVAEIVGRGITPKYADSGDVVVVNQRCIRDGRLTFDSARKHDSSKRVVKSEKQLQVGDILVNSTGVGTLGRTAPVRALTQATTADSHVTIVRPAQDSDPRWMAYAVRFHESEIEAMAEGSTGQTELSRHRLAGLRITAPPLPEQRAIAATLGALDDKIESNRRAVDTAQKLASSIFAQWRESAAVERVSTFGKFADVFGGATPKTAVPEYWGGGLHWATPTDVTNLSAPYLRSTARSITERGLSSCAAAMHPPGTIFMTSRATIGAFAINQVPAATNQGFIAVRAKREEDRWFLFEEMRSRVEEFIDNANGSTFLEISRGRFKELPLELPAEASIDALSRELAPIHERAGQLDRESQRLAALRDALLPELLSGRIRVPVDEVT